MMKKKPTAERLSPQELADALTKFEKMYGDAAGGMFGLFYADHLWAGSHERAPATIARIATLTCGADINVGLKMATHVGEIFGRAAVRAAASQLQQHAQEMVDAMWENAAAGAAEVEGERGRP